MLAYLFTKYWGTYCSQRKGCRLKKNKQSPYAFTLTLFRPLLNSNLSSRSRCVCSIVFCCSTSILLWLLTLSISANVLDCDDSPFCSGDGWTTSLFKQSCAFEVPISCLSLIIFLTFCCCLADELICWMVICCFTLASFWLASLKSFSNVFFHIRSCFSVSDKLDEYSVSVELLSLAEGLKVSSLSLSSCCSSITFFRNLIFARGISSSEELVMCPI